MDLDYAKKLIKETRENYDFLAENYARTRFFVPDDVKNLTKYAYYKEKVLDSGCANGRLFKIFSEKKVEYIGIDSSEKLIEIAQKNYPEGKFKKADALNLPFSDNFFNKVFSISVLHNIPSHKLRAKYLKETARVLKPKGFLILRVWDFWKNKQGLKLILKYGSLKLIRQSKLDFYDVFVPWKNSQRKVVAQRYFHCFTRSSIIKLVEKNGFQIRKAWQQGKGLRANIYIIAEKKN